MDSEKDRSSRVQSKSTTSLIMLDPHPGVNLNPLAGVPPHIIAGVKSEGELLCGGVQFCKQLWQQFRMLQNHEGEVSLVGMDMIFTKFSQELKTILKLQNLNDLLEAFDQNQDKCLNVEQQITIIQIIKHRMQEVANMLLRMQEYQQFKTLMQCVRTLEGLIVLWQDQLRTRRHKRQQEQYKKIGEEQIYNFLQKYEGQFNEFQHYKKKCKKQLGEGYNQARLQLNKSQSTGSFALKIKPKKELFDYQIQQRLVSLEERVEEAQDYRKYLKNLQRKQAQRLNSKIEGQKKIQKKKIEAKFAKAKRLQDLRLSEQYSKLVIKMREDYDLLMKKTHLHENQIKRLQALESQYFKKLGTDKPEMARKKMQSKQRNEVLMLKKKGDKQGLSLSKHHRQEDSTAKLKTKRRYRGPNYILDVLKKKQLINFNLNQLDQNKLPVNIEMDKPQSLEPKSVQKYLTGSSSQSFNYSLCDLYNRQLEEVQDSPHAKKVSQAQARKHLNSKIISLL